MVGHLDVPGLTDGMPASLSPEAIDGLLRREMGFDGLVVSDALGMGAIRQVATPEQAIVFFYRLAVTSPWSTGPMWMPVELPS